MRSANDAVPSTNESIVGPVGHVQVAPPGASRRAEGDLVLPAQPRRAGPSARRSVPPRATRDACARSRACLRAPPDGPAVGVDPPPWRSRGTRRATALSWRVSTPAWLPAALLPRPRSPAEPGVDASLVPVPGSPRQRRRRRGGMRGPRLRQQRGLPPATTHQSIFAPPRRKSLPVGGPQSVKRPERPPAAVAPEAARTTAPGSRRRRSPCRRGGRPRAPAARRAPDHAPPSASRRRRRPGSSSCKAPSAGAGSRRNGSATSDDRARPRSARPRRSGAVTRGRAQRVPPHEPPLLARVGPQRDQRAAEEDEPGEPDQVHERLDEHLEEHAFRPPLSRSRIT